MLKTLVRYLKLFRALFPSKLPTSFEQNPLWVNSVLDLYNLPKDNDSYVNAIESMIMQLGPTVMYKPKLYFGLAVQKSMANQVAYEFICQIREKHAEEEALKKQAQEAKHNEKENESKHKAV